LKNVFALGDACLTPMNEVKAISSIYQYVDIIAHNIEKVCKNHTDYKAMPRSIHRLSLVPIGKNYGFFLFNKMAIEKNDAHTMKLEMEENFVGF
jgi:NADH dehydrogenase FAD-containing subunit